jgi:hypothetical protein
MRPHMKPDFDLLMREMTLLGFAGLLVWSLTSAIGLLAGLVTLAPQATLRFLLAVLVLVFSRRTYWELREWRWRKLPPDERFGFANPLLAPSESSDHTMRSATEASQPQG